MKNNFWLQALKYGIVGVINTLVTAIVIWIFMHFVFSVKEDENVSATAITVSNIMGYIAGFINSFVWNRSWTFKSKKDWKVDFLKFSGAFLICFIPQLLLVNILNTYINISSIRFSLFSHDYVISFAYICQLIGMVFYTVLNFLLNKYYTFKK